MLSEVVLVTLLEKMVADLSMRWDLELPDDIVIML